MSGTALQAAQDRAKHHGIKIEMIDDILRYQIVVRGRLGDTEYRHAISTGFIVQQPTEALDGIYADAHNLVIDKLLGSRSKSNVSREVAELQRELDTYKSTVKMLAFQLEMAEQGGSGVLLKEDEVRRLALEQAAEHLMDHGVIATGSELVEVCEQIKKLQRSEVCV
jgi:hypothetical protein